MNMTADKQPEIVEIETRFQHYGPGKIVEADSDKAKIVGCDMAGCNEAGGSLNLHWEELRDCSSDSDDLVYYYITLCVRHWEEIVVAGWQERSKLKPE